MSDNFNMSANEAEKTIREFVEDRMAERGITRYRLQNLTGLNRTTIARWLDGETSITMGNYLKILGALEISPYFVPAEDEAIFKNQLFNQPKIELMKEKRYFSFLGLCEVTRISELPNGDFSVEEVFHNSGRLPGDMRGCEIMHFPDSSRYIREYWEVVEFYPSTSIDGEVDREIIFSEALYELHQIYTW